MLPANLPSVVNAKIPATYVAAKEAITECVRIDECKDWADKAEALASYAKQADDDSLRRMAVRIQARAVQRCGELLKQIAPAKNRHDSEKATRSGGDPPRHQAAKDAGLSNRQKKTALRVASVPVMEFDELVESDDPPTVTALAERGKKPSTAHLKGRNPEEFKLSTQVQGQLRSFAKFVGDVDPATAVRGAFASERKAMAEQSNSIVRWLGKLERFIEKDNRKE